MSDINSNPQYPPLTQKLYDAHSTPVKNPEVNEASTTPLSSLPYLRGLKTPVKMVAGSYSSEKQPMFSLLNTVD